MKQLAFHLNDFDGPLELLLYLISKHKMDIRDIEISLLLDQYMEYIEGESAADLEVASEFLEMAARLVYIKTVSLLPRQKEEGEALKQELTGQLLEYKRLKEAAGQLARRYNGGQILTRPPLELPVSPVYEGNLPVGALLKAYREALGKAGRRMPVNPVTFSPLVNRRMVSVTSRIVFILRKLYRTGAVPYGEFFVAGDRSELVATFLAMLELMKSRRITVNEDNTMVYFCRRSGKGGPEEGGAHDEE